MTVHRTTHPASLASATRRALLGSLFISAAALGVAGPAAAQPAGERRITLEQQTGVAVTIYNANLAMVRDQRRIRFEKGRNLLAFIDVSGQLRPETAILSAAKGVAFTLVEQNFNFDIMSRQTLLAKSVGRTIRVVKTNYKTGEETVVEAKVLSVAKGVVLQIGDRIYTGLPGRPVFDKIPDNLRARPTLVIDLHSAAARIADVALTYLSRGLSWRADYVAELNDEETSLDLNGWVTLSNRSGTTYKDAKLQLVAGDVNQVRQRLRDRRDFMFRGGARRPPPTDMARQALGDYHLYTLARPTTIAQNQTKQVALMRAPGVRVAKEYRVSGATSYYRSRYGLPIKTKAAVWLVIKNAKDSGLGLPLPKGIVRVYKRDKSGKATFVGEDRIGHTAEGETMRLQMGRAFGVSSERLQTDYARLTSKLYEFAYRVVLRNAKPTPVIRDGSDSAE